MASTNNRSAPRCARLYGLRTIIPYAPDRVRREGDLRVQAERIETAVVAGAKHASGPYEAWMASGLFQGGVKLVITGPPLRDGGNAVPLLQSEHVLIRIVSITEKQDL
jgi:hypothetical protein